MIRPGKPALLLLANNLDQHALAPIAVELSVENLFPGPEIQFAIRDRHHHLAAHHLAFHVRVRIVFAGAIVVVL